MGEQILSDTVKLPKTVNITENYIEKFLLDNYGNILRWAIIEINDNDLTINFSYRKAV